MKHVCIVGLGYVGLPLALALSKQYRVTGFDIDGAKVEHLKAGTDPSGEVDAKSLAAAKITFQNDPEVLREQDIIIICVPTPIDEAHTPDLSYLKSASSLVGKRLKKGAIVIYESTVYPGVTEEVCLPILEEASGLTLGEDFGIGYSPERLNPGDKEHTIEKIVKVVSASDEESLNKVDELYSSITKTHRAPSIRVAEAAKVIENIQRDLNIALMNELQILFDKMSIDMNEVLAAAGTKWNFHPYRPGLVGGHCIGVDPYYLTFKAESINYHPEIILAGRRINDHMHEFYANKIVKGLTSSGKPLKGAKVLILGLTFKADVKDARNSRVKQLITSLRESGIEVMACEPNLTDERVKEVFGVQNYPFTKLPSADLIFIAVKHKEFAGFTAPEACIIVDLEQIGEPHG